MQHEYLCQRSNDQTCHERERGVGGARWGEVVEEGKQVAVVVIDFVYVVTYVRDVCVGWGR